MFFRKSLAGLIIATFVFPIFPLDMWALSSGVISPENYPGKIEVKNVNGLGKNVSTDFFGGAMNFQYPLSFPPGSRGMTPTLTLSYVSNNTDAFSPYGYGFSLSIPRIQRSAKKGVSELYVGDEYAAFGNDLIKMSTSSGNYRSKDANDMNLYVQSGSTWSIHTPDGKTLIFGTSSSARIADLSSPTKIYAWLLEEERDAFGHSIRYVYTQDGGQPYITDIYYGYALDTGVPLYQIHFEYIDKKASLTSYRTQFEVSTKKLLSNVSLRVDGEDIRGYTLEYDTPDSPISHLISITEDTLPKTTFSYGNGQLQHTITTVDNNRGGKASFEYMPSTSYRVGSGGLSNQKLPFMVMTLSRQILKDTVTGISSEESYTYSGGHYYYDATNLWGREYVGFGQVSITDDKTTKHLYFHQSQTAESNILKYQDHISKKGRIYRADIYDKAAGILLQQELTKYDARVISPERRLVVPIEKINAEYNSDGTHRDTAIIYQYDDVGNLLEEKKMGLVSAHLDDGTFIDIPGDTILTSRTYTSSPEKNLYNFLTQEKIYGYSGELLSFASVEYDYTSSGVSTGLITAKKKQDTETGDTITTERIVYSPTGMPIERYDALDQKTTSAYDMRDIALVSTTNPLGWTTSSLYDYRVGKPTKVTNPNGVISMTRYDRLGRVIEISQDTGSGDIILSRTSYDDLHIPNSTTLTQYFDAIVSDQKSTTSYTDGWGRTIATISSTEKSGQYSATQIRYDDDGNPIYAGYPVFVSSTSLDTSLVLPGVTDGEQYRAIAPGVSYQYDAQDRIIRERSARGVTTKPYAPGRERITNALGYTTEACYDGYGNLSHFIEKIGDRDIITLYSYDALSRPISLTDAYGNIRNWSYDGLGRLAMATDIHSPTDTTYGTRTYMYDSLGRLIQYTTANQEVVSYAYDALSRITHESSMSGGVLDRTYSYDDGARSLGTLSSVSDAMSTVSYTYDPLGRKTGETRTLGARTYSLGYAYSPASVLTDITYPDGGHTQYSYKNGFIEGVSYTDASGQMTPLISDISYAPNSTMRSIRYGNGVVKNTERDANHNYRLTRATSTTIDGTKLLDTSYGYDAVSNITSISESGIDPLRKTVSYSYDPLARLTSTSYAYGVAGYGRDQSKNLSYTYDDIGNILTASDVGSYIYGATPLASPHAVTMAGDTSYSYDAAGHTILRVGPSDTLSFSYSPYGEMLSSTNGTDVTSYSYDHTRRRIVKSTPGLLEHHVVDGYEVEYESGALVFVPDTSPVTLQSTSTGGVETPTVDTGAIDIGTGTTLTDTGTTSTGTTETGALVESTGSTSSGESLTLPETTSTGVSASDTVSTGSALTSTSILVDTGALDTSSASTGEVLSVSMSGDVSTGTYMVIASYTLASASGATPVDITTTLTHIYLGDERIATFQSQTDDTPRTPDDDRLIYHISDHLSSSSLDLSITGALLQATDYLPFGKSNVYEVTSKRIKGKKGGYKNKYLFANKQLDEETDLQYFEKRYYDNRIGRFTTEDPVAWELSRTERPDSYFISPQNWNTYSYTLNNPINMTDPSGELAIAAAPAVVFVYTGPVGLALGGIALAASVIGGLAVALTKSTTSSNNNSQSQAKTGAGQTNQGNVSQVQMSTASPPPGGGGPKKGGNNSGDNKGDRGVNRNKNSSKDYAQIAKEKGMKETKEFGLMHNQKVYKFGNKYYSPEGTAHNTDMGWKVFEKVSGKLSRIGTADEFLNIFKD